MKLQNIHYEMLIEASAQTIWETLRQYGDVSNFHGGVVKSSNVNGSENEASLGADRVCNIRDMGMNIVLKEKIIDYIEGESYRYEVYETKNFPVKAMFFEFSILQEINKKAYLRLDIDYKAKPAFLTPFLKPKMQKLTRDILLGYKNHIETDSTKVSVSELRKIYKTA